MCTRAPPAGSAAAAAALGAAPVTHHGAGHAPAAQAALLTRGRHSIPHGRCQHLLQALHALGQRLHQAVQGVAAGAGATCAQRAARRVWPLPPSREGAGASAAVHRPPCTRHAPVPCKASVSVATSSVRSRASRRAVVAPHRAGVSDRGSVRSQPQVSEHHWVICVQAGRACGVGARAGTRACQFARVQWRVLPTCRFR